MHVEVSVCVRLVNGCAVRTQLDPFTNQIRLYRHTQHNTNTTTHTQ